MSDKPERVYVAQLAARELTTSPFPAEGQQAFLVYFDLTIHERIAAHAAEKLTVEICGVLVGDWHRDENGPFVLINEAVRANKAVSNAGDVTFTHDAWNEVNHEMDTKYTDRKIVGWYHTHPNFGIFLSDRDCFIQEHFFNSPGQIAYVVDPINGVEGIFCWRNGKSKLLPNFWVGDEIHLSSQGKERTASSVPAANSTSAAPKQQPLPPPTTLLTMLLAAVCLLILGYLLGNMRSNYERLQTEVGAVAQYGLFKGLKPGMHENLDNVQGNLQAIAQAVDQLAKEHIKVAGDGAEEKKKQWTEVLQGLLKTAIEVQKINQVYSLSPDEAAAVQQLINQKEAETTNVMIPPAGDAAKSSGSQTAKSTGNSPAVKSSGEAPAKTSGAPAVATPASETPAATKSTAAAPAPAH